MSDTPMFDARRARCDAGDHREWWTGSEYVCLFCDRFVGEESVPVRSQVGARPAAVVGHAAAGWFACAAYLAAAAAALVLHVLAWRHDPGIAAAATVLLLAVLVATPMLATRYDNERTRT